MVRRSSKPTTGKARRGGSGDTEEPISPALLRELKRTLKDVRDPTRYVVVSAFGPRFILYYNVVSGDYPLNDVSHATLFKRLKVAKAVIAALGDGHSVMTVRLTKDGSVKRVTPLRTIVRESELPTRKTRIPPNPGMQRTRYARR